MKRFFLSSLIASSFALSAPVLAQDAERMTLNDLMQAATSLAPHLNKDLTEDKARQMVQAKLPITLETITVRSYESSDGVKDGGTLLRVALDLSDYDIPLNTDHHDEPGKNPQVMFTCEGEFKSLQGDDLLSALKRHGEELGLNAGHFKYFTFLQSADQDILDEEEAKFSKLIEDTANKSALCAFQLGISEETKVAPETITAFTKLVLGLTADFTSLGEVDPQSAHPALNNNSSQVVPLVKAALRDGQAFSTWSLGDGTESKLIETPDIWVISANSSIVGCTPKSDGHECSYRLTFHAVDRFDLAPIAQWLREH